MSAQLARAFAAFAAARFEVAADEALKHLANQPEDASATALLARCRCVLGEVDASIELAKRAVGFDPEHAYAIDSLVRILFDARRYDDCRAAIRTGLRLDPENADFFGIEAWIEYREGDDEYAIRAARRGLKIAPEHIECLLVKAFAEYRTGDGPASRFTCDAVLRLDPSEERALRLSGWVAVLEHKHDEAQAHFHAALQRNPNDELAREGFIAAVRGRSPLFSWLHARGESKGSANRIAWVFIAGSVWLSSLARGFVRPGAEPTVAWLTIVALFMLVTFVVLNARAFALVWVWRDRSGRRMLEPRERASACVALFGTIALVGFEIAALAHLRPPGLESLAGFMLVFPMFAAFRASRICDDDHRRTHAQLVGLDFVLALAAIGAVFVDAPRVTAACVAAAIVLTVVVTVHATFAAK